MGPADQLEVIDFTCTLNKQIWPSQIDTEKKKQKMEERDSEWKKVAVSHYQALQQLQNKPRLFFVLSFSSIYDHRSCSGEVVSISRGFTALTE